MSSLVRHFFPWPQPCMGSCFFSKTNSLINQVLFKSLPRLRKQVFWFTWRKQMKPHIFYYFFRSLDHLKVYSTKLFIFLRLLHCELLINHLAAYFLKHYKVTTELSTAVTWHWNVCGFSVKEDFVYFTRCIPYLKSLHFPLFWGYRRQQCSVGEGITSSSVDPASLF